MPEDENTKKIQEKAEEEKEQLAEQAAPVMEEMKKTDSTQPVPISDPPEASEQLSPKPPGNLTYDIDGNPNAY